MPFRRYYFSFILGWFLQFDVVYASFALRRFWPLSQWPGCRLFSSFDIHIHIYLYIYISIILISTCLGKGGVKFKSKYKVWKILPDGKEVWKKRGNRKKVLVLRLSSSNTHVDVWSLSYFLWVLSPIKVPFWDERR